MSYGVHKVTPVHGTMWKTFYVSRDLAKMSRNGQGQNNWYCAQLYHPS